MKRKKLQASRIILILCAVLMALIVVLLLFGTFTRLQKIGLFLTIISLVLTGTSMWFASRARR